MFFPQLSEKELKKQEKKAKKEKKKAEKKAKKAAKKQKKRERMERKRANKDNLPGSAPGLARQRSNESLEVWARVRVRVYMCM